MSAIYADPVRTAAVSAVRDVLAIEEVGSSEWVHQLRVCTKRLRAYLRLYSGKPSIRKANRQLKALADSVAEQRDTDVLRQTYDQLVVHWFPRKSKKYRKVYLDLIIPKQIDSQAKNKLDTRAAFEKVLLSWPNIKDKPKFWAVGMERVYLKAKYVGAEAVRGDEDEPYHRWRKWVKYWLYNLSGVSKGKVQRSYQKQLKGLGESLGYFHDLCMLESVLVAPENQRVIGNDMGALIKALKKEKKQLKKSFKQAHRKLFKLNNRKLLAMVGA